MRLPREVLEAGVCMSGSSFLLTPPTKQRECGLGCHRSLLPSLEGSVNKSKISWTLWELNPRPSPCEGEIIPLDQAPFLGISCLSNLENHIFLLELDRPVTFGRHDERVCYRARMPQLAESQRATKDNERQPQSTIEPSKQIQGGLEEWRFTKALEYLRDNP